MTHWHISETKIHLSARGYYEVQEKNKQNTLFFFCIKSKSMFQLLDTSC